MRRKILAAASLAAALFATSVAAADLTNSQVIETLGRVTTVGADSYNCDTQTYSFEGVQVQVLNAQLLAPCIQHVMLGAHDAGPRFAIRYSEVNLFYGPGPYRFGGTIQDGEQGLIHVYFTN